MSDPHRPLKNAFGRFATGVTVAGCLGPDGAPVFITVNSFASVSLAPPLVLWCLERKASTFPAFMASNAYTISVLHGGQKQDSERFAAHNPVVSPDAYERWVTGAPILKERLAGFDCHIVQRHMAGDHVILVGEVAKFDAQGGAPLLYYASRYAEGPEAEE